MNASKYHMGKSGDLPYPLSALEDIVDIDGEDWKYKQIIKKRMIHVEDILGTTKSYLDAHYVVETDTLGFSPYRRENIRKLLDNGMYFNSEIRVIGVVAKRKKKYFILNDGNHRLSVMREKRAKFINAEIRGFYVYKRGNYDFSKFYKQKRNVNMPAF